MNKKGNFSLFSGIILDLLPGMSGQKVGLTAGRNIKLHAMCITFVFFPDTLCLGTMEPGCSMVFPVPQVILPFLRSLTEISAS